MKVSFNYKDSVIVLPGSTINDLTQASREELCVLLSAAARPDASAKEHARLLGLSEREVANAISFWRGAGVIVTEKDNEKASAAKGDDKAEKKADEKRPPRRIIQAGAGELPHYSTEEVATSVVRPEFSGLIDHCQQLMGKILNPSEVEKVVGICKYLTVSPEFVALLCSHLKEEGHLNLRSLEKRAAELHDRGISGYDELLEHIELREKCRSLEGRIRSLFGLGKRALTPTERRYLESWSSLPFEMVEYAYELTVNATGEAPMKYTDSIIGGWIAKGISTLADAKRADEEFQRTKKPRSKKKAQSEESAVSSFNTDDFFEAAMRRSYGNDGGDLK